MGYIETKYITQLSPYIPNIGALRYSAIQQIYEGAGSVNYQWQQARIKFLRKYTYFILQ